MRQMAMVPTLIAAGLVAGIAAVLPDLALAEEWRPLDAPAIVLALSSHSLRYEDGQTQAFHADGTTQLGAYLGKWRVRGDLYCSTWPPRQSWTCYAVERRGNALRFVGEVGNTTVGHYYDYRTTR